MLSFAPVPVQEIFDPVIQSFGVRLLVKRDDLIHPQISGNKWRKLKYNLLEANNQQKKRLLTFGGAFSNHILAVAAAGSLFGFETVGIIRGEEHLPLNTTLKFAKNAGMKLYYLDRNSYRNKSDATFIKELKEQFGDFYMIPEGGSNEHAVKGCAETVDEIEAEYDYIACACGTGATLAGIVAGLNGRKKAIGIAALKGAEFLYDDIRKLLSGFDEVYKANTALFTNWQLELDYHFGGYAKTKPDLLQFITTFRQVNKIEIEPIYTGKLFYCLYDLIRNGSFKRGETIVAIHTGGLRNF